MNRLRLIKTAYTALAALMLAACASDELTDGTVLDLPEGKYPLQISSVTMSAESTAQPWAANAPQSRVSENTNGNSSEWNEGDEITVQLSGRMADNSIIHATAYSGAAAIGFGRTYDGGTIPAITITGTPLYLTVTDEGAGIGFGRNEDNSKQTLGPIKITSSNEDESTFFAKERFNVKGYKVGKSSNNYSNQNWKGVTFNGNTLVDGSSNGYK